MKITTPDYFEDFKCVSDRCKATCCKAGWEIVIDNETAELYKKSDSPLAKELSEGVKKDKDGDLIFKSKNGACVFLQDDGLCKIHSVLGHGALCRVCRDFPRFTYEYGSLLEKGISLSCPEAARIILSKSSPVEFSTKITDEPVTTDNNIDADLFFLIYKARSVAFALLQFRKYPIERRAFWLLKLAKALQKQIDKRNFEKAEKILEKFSDEEYLACVSPKQSQGDIKLLKKTLLSLEILSKDWRHTVKSLDNPKNPLSDCETAFEDFLMYWCLKYFLTAAYDGRLAEKVKLSIFSFIAVKEIYSRIGGGFESLVMTSVQYSREIEHCEDNLKKLYSLFSRKGGLKLSSYLA